MGAVAAVLALSGCTVAVSPSAAELATRTPAATPATTERSVPTTTTTSPATPSFSPLIPSSTPLPERHIVVTLYGTDATFTWTDVNGQLHQRSAQNGPVSYELRVDAYGTPVTVNANVFTMHGDAKCEAKLDTFTVATNMADGQTAASCLKTFG